MLAVAVLQLRRFNSCRTAERQMGPDRCIACGARSIVGQLIRISLLLTICLSATSSYAESDSTHRRRRLMILGLDGVREDALMKAETPL